jgi:hypothetical protein
MSYFTKLHTLNNIFSILLVALIITIFEICFFYIIMVPRIRSIVNNNINNISNKFKNKNLSINVRIDNLLTKIFIDNQDLLNKINSESIKNEIKKEIKNEINNKKNEIFKNKNEIINEIKNEIKNEIINEIKNEVKNEVKNKINNEKNNKNKTIEYFNDNQRLYKPLFDKTIADEISTIIIKILQKNNIELDENYKDYIKKLVVIDFDYKILSILETLKYDEKHIIDNNNNNTFIISITVIIIILLLLKIFYNNISLLNIETGGGSGVENKVYITSFIIIVIIIIFLINFYFFGIAFNYKKNDEILFHIFNNIEL